MYQKSINLYSILSLIGFDIHIFFLKREQPNYFFYDHEKLAM